MEVILQLKVIWDIERYRKTSSQKMMIYQINTSYPKTWCIEPTKDFHFIKHIIIGFININSSPSSYNGRQFADDIFKWNFINEKFCILIQISLKFCSWGSNWQKVSIGSGNDLAQNRQQAITRTNVDRRIYAALGGVMSYQSKWHEISQDVSRHFQLCHLVKL